MATSYYKQIFESSNLEEVDEALADVSTTIIESINEELTGLVT